MSEQTPQAEPIPLEAQESTDDVFFVALHFKGQPYNVPVMPGEPVSTIFDFVQEVLDFPRENCRIICKGKQLRLDDEIQAAGTTGLSPGCKVMLVASSNHDIEFIQNSRPDPLVKGFAELERDEEARRRRTKQASMSAWGTKQDPEYRFNSIKAEFKYNSPSPYEAERLLQKLSTDPGIIEIMKSRSFKVGILTEMSPAEAQERMAKKGTPGMDLLGYNQNAGEMIVLKLRTDNTKGFRPYHDLINTLIHELTHNVWGDHDHNFWRLFGELKAQYMRFHRFWSHGGQTADSNSSGQFSGFAGQDDDGKGGSNFGNVLGGKGDEDTSSMTEAERRNRALAAAEGRASGGPAPTLPVFDFFSNAGEWMMMCPCGQKHPMADCPVGSVALQDAEASKTATDDVDEIAASGKTEVQMPTDSSLSNKETEMEVDATPAAEVAPPMAADQPAEKETLPDPTPEPMEDVVQVGDSAADAPDVAMDQSPDRSSAEPPVAAESSEPEEDIPGLSVDDLSALGLDGAVVWLERFNQQLQALKKQRHPAARPALELLLRLVRNVVDSPHEAKFRRVRADNPKVRSSLLSVGAEAEALMTMLGFESAQEDGQRVFVLRDALYDSARLQMGKEIIERQLSSAIVA